MSEVEDQVIQVAALTKTFRDFWGRARVKAVNGISFAVGRGEVFGLLGPNGSGKSTTIKMMLGLLHSTSGSIRMLGRDPRHVGTKARIGYLPEESYLYPYLNARETLGFYGKLFDLHGAERRQRIEQLLEMVGLEHTGRRMVGEFSKGMARRIGLAQALINDPEIVILDEPTSGLDPIGTRQVKNLILTLAERGKTVILSSHLLADVEDVCDRVAILYGGKIRAEGPMRTLLDVRQEHELRLPELDPEVLERVLAAVREALGEEPEVRHPRRNLESFFLEVIEKAKSEAAETSGAQSGREVAEYLGGEKGDVLERLTRRVGVDAGAEVEKAGEGEGEAGEAVGAAEGEARLREIMKQREQK